MTKFNCPFTDQDYTDYKRANYKHYDDRKIQELHSRVAEQIKELASIHELDHYVRGKMIWILDWLNKAEIHYENSWYNPDKSRAYHYEDYPKMKTKERDEFVEKSNKKKRWWQIWK
jgi:hypothetical protein